MDGVSTTTGHYSLQDIFDTLASSLRFEEVLDRILEVTLRELSAQQGSLMLLQGEDHPVLKMLAQRGLPPEIANRGYVPRRGSISEYVLRERRPLIINEQPRSTDFTTLSEETGAPRQISSALCVPLIARGKVIGTMNINRASPGAHFHERDLETCAIIAGQAALVIEHRRLQEELIQSERLAAVGQVVAGISHCMKNILAGVKGGLGLAEMGLTHNRDELVRQGFDLLKRNTGTLSNLMLDLLDYSKEREPMREVFNLNDVLHHVLDTIRFKAEAAKVEVREEITSALTFYGDRDQLFRAILNLMTNAVEAFQECDLLQERWVLLRAEEREFAHEPDETGPAGHHIVIEVVDNGAGIPDDQQAAIWDLFFSTKGSRGSGIGLATARKMIEEHKGRIQLHSAPGQGTRFVILLPVMEE